MYNNEQINKILEGLKRKKNVKEKFLEIAEEYSDRRDFAVIKEAVTNLDFFAEDFDRYDSDVCEQFLRYWEELRKKACFYFLEDLRRSGQTNMLGAVPYLMEEYKFDYDYAKEILYAWIDGYDRSNYRREFPVIRFLDFPELFLERGV